jgi:hopene-associated glycosyltransferase HpnB
MAAGTLAGLSCLIWLYLLLARGRFWQSAPQIVPGEPVDLPDIDVIVPARDEAVTIGAAIGSLLAQDYAGRFTVTLVDDCSTDGTAAAAGESPRLCKLAGQPKPDGWSGKLWAMHQGVAATAAPWVLFTDADIVHDRRHLSALVAQQQRCGAAMTSEMVRLRCESPAERALVPAFVYFFQMLYPFAWVNQPRSRTAAAAGGTILIRRATLVRIGGLATIRGALIDDVALAAAVKPVAPVYLGHSTLAASIRAYPRYRDIRHMISRTAFAQLRFSGLLLALTVAGMALVWAVPVGAALFAHGPARLLGLGACTMAALSFVPTLRRYGQSPLRALCLPLIAVFYTGATIGSALDHWRGRGARWKDRLYSRAQP